MADCPCDLSALRPGAPDPRVRWPVSRARVNGLNATLQQEVVRTAAALAPGPARDVYLAASMALLVNLLTVSVARLAAAGALRSGLRFSFGGPSLVRTFSEGGRLPEEAFLEPLRWYWRAALKRSPLNPLRRLAHSAVANRGWRWVWPRVRVLNHNHLLQAVARRDTNQSFVFDTADRLFHGQPAPPRGAEARDLREVADHIGRASAAVLANHGVPQTSSFGDQVARCSERLLFTAAGHYQILQARWRRPPRVLWTGSGGNYFTRLARLAVRRAGGQVTGFEHGGSAHILADQTVLHIHELAFADRFVVDTPDKAEVFRRGLSAERCIDPPLAEIVASPVPQANFAWRLFGSPGSEVRRVMYVTTAFVGEMQYPSTPLLPDPVYADWQGRLLEGLAQAGFEVQCKQHPEGLRGGEPLVMSSRARYLGGRFAQVMDQADAYVFDYPATTALWEAMCTDKPVAFIDCGLIEWEPEVWDSFSRRVAVVPAEYDEWNRPRVSFEALADALRRPRVVDHEFARRFLVGSGPELG